jgi:glycosyltransferase involved in cell wall biosynthesis
MRIDFVITELDVGGAERTLVEIAIRMQERGHRVRLLAIGSAPAAPKDWLVQKLRQHRVPVVFGGFDHWAAGFRAMRWLRSCFRNDPPDLCQTFLFHANCLGTFSARAESTPCVVGGLRVAESRRLRLLLERQAVGRMDRLVCVSESVQRFAVERLGAVSDRSLVIPNGIDLQWCEHSQPVQWEQLGWPNDSEVVLFVGRLHPQKGLELLQQQWASIHRGDSRRRLLMVGDGPLGESIAAWTETESGTGARCLPWQSDVRPLMKAARLLVLPSHYEGMPNVVLEAMACGKPVVCSLVEGSTELLAETGGDLERRKTQGFPPGDGKAMAERIVELLENSPLAEKLGRANQGIVAAEFGLAKMVDRYERLYKELVGDLAGKLARKP